MLVWNAGNIAFFQPDGSVRLYQPHFRRNLLVGPEASGFLAWLAAGGAVGRDKADVIARWQKHWKARDATRFTLIDHAYSNPAMFDDARPLADGDEIGGDKALMLLTGAGFLTSPDKPITQAKTSPFDRFKGSFYEQIGTECLLRRQDPEQWWVDQKFEDDRSATRPTPYRFIQDVFLTDFLAREAEGRAVLEVGCGTGYFTHKVAQHAALAVGLDYNADYVATARHRRVAEGEKTARYEIGDIIDLTSTSEAITGRTFDMILMIDVFLFLFDERYQAKLSANRERILGNVARLLAPDGRLVIMDPHPLFLTPWFGDTKRPFGILEAYRSHDFRVAPTLSEVTDLLSRCGLSIHRIHEPRPSPDLAAYDKAAYHFFSEVPPWWVLETHKAST